MTQENSFNTTKHKILDYIKIYLNKDNNIEINVKCGSKDNQKLAALSSVLADNYGLATLMKIFSQCYSSDQLQEITSQINQIRKSRQSDRPLVEPYMVFSK